jgi:hypothetical protein
MYSFVLNPYRDARFTSCPICEAKMRSRKLPFVVHIDPQHLIVLNMTARYCPDDDLVILHKDKLEALLAAMFAQHTPEVIGNEYLVLGTIERTAFRQGASNPLTIEEMLGAMHDFKEHLKLEPAHYGWVYTGPIKDKPAR